MAKDQKVSKTTTFTKLFTDFANNFVKPLAIIADPIAGIVFYSLALYLSWQHAQAHFMRIEEKAKIRGKHAPTSKAKTYILIARLFFDFLGLGLSVALLLGHFVGGYILSVFGKAAIFGIAALSMTVSSVLSTAHKFRRSFKPDATHDWGNIGRLVMGVAGTVFLPLVVYGVISAAFLSSPPALLVGSIIVGAMGIAKGRKAYQAYKEQKVLRRDLKALDLGTAQGITQLQAGLEKLHEIGDLHAHTLMLARLNQMVNALVKVKGELPVAALGAFQNYCNRWKISRKAIETRAHQPPSAVLMQFLDKAFPAPPPQDLPAAVEASSSSQLLRLSQSAKKLVNHSGNQADKQNKPDDLDDTQPKYPVLAT